MEVTVIVAREPDRRILRGAAIGFASGLTAGTLYALLTPDVAVAHGAAVGVVAGTIGGVLHAALHTLTGRG